MPGRTESPIADISPTVAPLTEAASDSSIRKIDFKNFTYTGPDDYQDTFRLLGGEIPYVHRKVTGIVLNEVIFSDLTKDGAEEAILVMGVQTGGSSLPNLVYVYTLGDDKPKVLWKFISGDRAEGGLKKIYAENGEFVVELFGQNRFGNDKWHYEMADGEPHGLCCPTAFTRIRFHWNGTKFVPAGKPEIIEYDWKGQADAK